jgi:hypothetical protein
MPFVQATPQNLFNLFDFAVNLKESANYANFREWVPRFQKTPHKLLLPIRLCG